MVITSRQTAARLFVVPRETRTLNPERALRTQQEREYMQKAAAACGRTSAEKKRVAPPA
jgi:hypothetical protein